MLALIIVGVAVVSGFSRRDMRNSSHLNRFPLSGIETSTHPSASGHRIKVLYDTLIPHSWSQDGAIKPALTNSLFPNIPPTINFVAKGEEVEKLPRNIRNLMKWQANNKTAELVKRCVTRVGFTMTTNNNEWMGAWGVHSKPVIFKTIRHYQKYNHFPGTWAIGRKDNLWRNLNKMQMKFGIEEFGFSPQTYVIPKDLSLLQRAFKEGGTEQMWIVKPPASYRGEGIEMISKLSQLPKNEQVIVQRYIANPYLINDLKFDIRLYVYVSSFDPLSLYVFQDGLVRFATMKYSASRRNIHNRFIHLTNYSVNKKNPEYQFNNNHTACQGHKWSLKALWNFMESQGVNTTEVWENIKDAIIKTVISADMHVNKLVKANCNSRYCVHELFGFDILLDENLKPWLLEVNISPSLNTDSLIDVDIKDHMIKDLLNIAGFHIPDGNDLVENHTEILRLTKLRNYRPQNNLCMDKRLFKQVLSKDEKVKHSLYCKKHQDRRLVEGILDTLTPDDIRMLTESIDEDIRKGGFQRVFPTSQSHKYLKYFQKPRYYNLLLDQWNRRYDKRKASGVSLLRALCEEKIHLGLY